MTESRTEDLILPISICFTQTCISCWNLIAIRINSEHSCSKLICYQFTILISWQYVEILWLCTNGKATIIRYLCPTASLLCRNNDNTIWTTRTVDGCCRSIFQYVKRLNILWINKRQRVGNTLNTRLIHCHTINNNQWIIRSIQRRATTNTDCGASARSTTIACDAHTSNFTRKHILRINNEAFVLTIRLQSRYRSCKVTFLHSSITNNNHLIHLLCLVIFKYNNHTIGCCHLLLLITNVRNRQRCTWLYIDSKVTIKVSYSAIGCSVDKNRSTNDWFTGCILHVSSNSRLCKGIDWKE